MSKVMYCFFIIILLVSYGVPFVKAFQKLVDI